MALATARDVLTKVGCVYVQNDTTPIHFNHNNTDTPFGNPDDFQVLRCLPLQRWQHTLIGCVCDVG